MTQGNPITRREKELIWKMVAQGVRQFRLLSQRTGLHPTSVRDVVLDGCVELHQRLKQDKRAAEIDEITDPH